LPPVTIIYPAGRVKSENPVLFCGMSHTGTGPFPNEQPMSTPPYKVGDKLIRHCPGCESRQEHWVIGYSEVYEPLGILQLKDLDLKIRVARGFELSCQSCGSSFDVDEYYL
jgi:hypothetical protein